MNKLTGISDNYIIHINPLHCKSLNHFPSVPASQEYIHAMPRLTRQQLIEQGILTPKLLAELLNVSVTYMRRLCRLQHPSNKALETFNIASTIGKNEHRIHPSAAIRFCRDSLGLKDENIPPLLFTMERNASRSSIIAMNSIEQQESSKQKATEQNAT